MKGVYVLIIEVPEDKHLIIKALGDLLFERGIWLYVGSAMGGGSTSLENRINRHFRKEKTVHWHIDALLRHSTNLQAAIWAESFQSMECQVAKKFERMDEFNPGHRGFGASDCSNHCTSHLFYCKDNEKVQDLVSMIFVELDLKPSITFDGRIMS
ncbi:MAG: GIY-YIG nuclease family protein [Candidatus Thorarchaeota archaeon]|nr:GIY-YIG nuclease family protein [Candidatus Thorarchaeota archaeon]